MARPQRNAAAQSRLAVKEDLKHEGEGSSDTESGSDYYGSSDKSHCTRHPDRDEAEKRGKLSMELSMLPQRRGIATRTGTSKGAPKSRQQGKGMLVDLSSDSSSSDSEYEQYEDSSSDSGFRTSDFEENLEDDTKGNNKGGRHRIRTAPKRQRNQKKQNGVNEAKPNLDAAHGDAIKCESHGQNRRGKQNTVDESKLDWYITEQEWDIIEAPSDAIFDSLVGKKEAPEQMEPPAELLMPLLPFQKEWLAWSLKQEAAPMKGGILADEMGMGKTIQAISLVLAARRLHTESPSSPATLPVLASSSFLEPVVEIKATLVVCPLVAVLQWRNEIARFTASGTMKVLVYHGPRRGIGLAELATYDVVLTTYSIVELEFRKNVAPPKESCKWCGKHFYQDRLIIHQRFYCGPGAKRTEKQAKQVKLTKSKVSSKLSKKLDAEDYTVPTDGRGRKRKVVAQEQVFALAVEERDAHGSKRHSMLHSVKWRRIILDEAHSIKDRTCSTAKAVFTLQSIYKWALSGTPLQNRVGELYSLVRFLGIQPYSYYFCQKCNCKSLDYQFARHGNKCECGHSPLHHFCWWNKFIANPIKKRGAVLEGKRAMMLLKNRVLSSTLLRRTKMERAADLALPPRVACLRRDAFDTREDDFYQALYTQSKSQFNTYVTAGTLVNNYAHIFDLLTRLRQAVDHPYLVVYSATSCTSGRVLPSFDSGTGEEVCPICHEVAEDPVATGCKHTFCRSCIHEVISAAGMGASLCPTCKKPMTVDLNSTTAAATSKEWSMKISGYKRSSILSRINLEQFQTSTKIDAVREEIHLMLQKDPAAKAIIFSQFTSMLDLIAYSLQKSRIASVKLDGSMSMSARDQVIERFTNDVDCKVFLMSLKAGGVALNLTVASNVFLMDPWWNPAVEQQAQDRIHRLGQYKPIRVIRFVIENTIEERILRLQEKKQLVFEGTVGGSAEALGRLNEADLRFLFSN